MKKEIEYKQWREMSLHSRLMQKLEVLKEAVAMRSVGSSYVKKDYLFLFLYRVNFGI